LSAPEGVTVVAVETTEDMAAAVQDALPTADVLIMAAAPADFRPSQRSETKRPRVDGAMSLEVEPTEDILMATRTSRSPGSVTVGFALETGDAITKGRDKLQRKDLDLIVINDALEPGAGFEVDTNRVTIVERDGQVTEVPLQSKAGVAEAILDVVECHRVTQTAVSGTTE
jgi:phosphopantothenoylcysteine decarboxylase/phosphopantothenate--cysteine ligase